MSPAPASAPAPWPLSLAPLLLASAQQLVSPHKTRTLFLFRFIKMVLLLLVERRKGRASALWGYIDQLPRGLDTPVRWGEEELQQLQYAPVIEEVKGKGQEGKEGFHRSS